MPSGHGAETRKSGHAVLSSVSLCGAHRTTTRPHERHVYVYASPSRASSLEISIHYRNV